MQVSCPKAQLEGLPEESILPCGDTNASEKPSRSKKLWRGGSQKMYHSTFGQKKKMNYREKKKQRKYKCSGRQLMMEVVKKAPPWESRATRSQLQGKKEGKKKKSD